MTGHGVALSASDSLAYFEQKRDETLQKYESAVGAQLDASLKTRLLLDELLKITEEIAGLKKQVTP